MPAASMPRAVRAAFRRDGERRDASGSRRHRSWARSACGRPPTCATASKYSRSACHSDHVDFEKDELSCSKWRTRFIAATRNSYTYSLRDQEVVLVNARVAAIGELPALPQSPRYCAATAGACPVGERDIYLGKWRKVPIYRFDALAPGPARSTGRR